METVVEVGRPNVLKTSSSITSVNMTARKINMMSWKENRAGMNTPLLAISIMPLENSEPMMIPKAATSTIALRGAALEPTAEFKKLAASLETPTTRSKQDNTSISPMIK